MARQIDPSWRRPWQKRVRGGAVVPVAKIDRIA